MTEGMFCLTGTENIEGWIRYKGYVFDIGIQEMVDLRHDVTNVI